MNNIELEKSRKELTSALKLVILGYTSWLDLNDIPEKERSKYPPTKVRGFT